MIQKNKYFTESLGVQEINILNKEDANLVPTRTIDEISFIADKYTVDLNFYDLNSNYVETYRNINSYKIRGAVQASRVVKIEVNPIQDALDREYNGDIQLSYEVFNNLFSPNKASDSKANLFLSEISTDRTEIRTRAVDLDSNSVKAYVDKLYSRLNGKGYFSEAYLDFFQDNIKVPCTNVMTEVIDNIMYVTFKLYEALPANVSIKSRFNVIERIGQPVWFKVIREVDIISDTYPKIKGPNFNIEATEPVTSNTEYVSTEQLYNTNSTYTQLLSIYKESGASISVDFSDFNQFIHFSSAAERLQNFRDKMVRLEEIANLQTAGKLSSTEAARLSKDILSHFDPYERFLYFEKGDKCWPKINNVKPYTNVSVENARAWFSSRLVEAEAYDEQNVDLLANTIPQGIRENEDNLPYEVFVHMIGHHFDDIWIYAKAVADKYDADNRLNFGASKDLVKDLVKDFGLELNESKDSLTDLFNSWTSDGNYNMGDERGVYDLKVITSANYNITKDLLQPVLKDQYRKEVYKRIYHNIPLLLQTKGTERCLRTFINCFGIPESRLPIRILGGVPVEHSSSYFGPTDITTASIDRVRVASTADQRRAEYYTQGTGTYALDRPKELSNYISTRQAYRSNRYSDDTHQIELGFDLNQDHNDYIREELANSTFSFDNILGDSSNLDENYGTGFRGVWNQIMPTGSQPSDNFRPIAATLRLIKYYDSMLFRSIKDLLPAKASISTGALIKDNYLHRSRYVGSKPEVTAEDNLTGEINTTFISGSNGGVIDFKTAWNPNPGHNRKVYTAEDIKESTGLATQIAIEDPSTSYHKKYTTSNKIGRKAIFDNSPSYNGELSGTDLTVSTGETFLYNEYEGKVISGNPYLHYNGGLGKYKVSFKFLSLPKYSSCNFEIEVRSEGNLFEVKFLYGSSSYTIVSSSFINTLDDSARSGASIDDDIDAGSASTNYPVDWDGGNGTMPEPVGSIYTPIDTNVGVLLSDDNFAAIKIKHTLASDKTFLGWYIGIPGDRNCKLESYLGDGYETVGSDRISTLGVYKEQLQGTYTARYAASSDSISNMISSRSFNSSTGTLRLTLNNALKSSELTGLDIKVAGTRNGAAVSTLIRLSASDIRGGTITKVLPELLDANVVTSDIIVDKMIVTSGNVTRTFLRGGNLHYCYLNNTLFRTDW